MAGPYRRVHAPRNATIEERLRLHMIEAPSGCWIWLGARNRYGHGRIQIQGQTAYAHRVSYETFVGPIPAGLQIDHLCRRPACIKPLHLQAVTPRTNIERASGFRAQSMRTGMCKRGHAFDVHGYTHKGRRHCRPCRAEHLRRFHERAALLRTKDAAA